MTSSIKWIIGLVVSIMGIASRFYFFILGKRNEKAKIDKADAEILERQRDNDVTNVAECNELWDDIRENNSK